MQRVLQHIQAGRLGDAERALRQLLQMDPSHADALHALGAVLGMQGRHAEAIPWFQKTQRLRPDHIDAHRFAALAQKSLGRLGEAVASCRHGVALNPASIELKRQLCDYLIEAEEFVEAESVMRDILQALPDPIAADDLNRLGAILMHRRKFEEALSCFRQIHRLDAGFAAAWRNSAGVLYTLGRLDEAIADYRRLLTIEPDAAEAWQKLGECLSLQGNWTESTPLLRRANPSWSLQDTTVFHLSTLYKKSSSLECLYAIARLLDGYFAMPDQFLEIMGSLEIHVGRQMRSMSPADFAELRYGIIGNTYLRFLNFHKQSLAVAPMPRVENPARIDRIVVLTNLFVGMFHSPTLAVAQYAAAFSRLGKDVLLLNTNLLPRGNDPLFYTNLVFNQNKGLSGHQMLNFNGLSIPMFTASYDKPALERARESISVVERFSPSVVFSLAETDLVADSLYSQYPVVFEPFSMNWPVTLCHSLILPFPSLIDMTGKDGRVPKEHALQIDRSPKVHILRHYYDILPPAGVMSRSQFGVPEDSVLFLVVGNRLDVEICRDLESIIAGLLKACPRAAFLFVHLADFTWHEAAIRDALGSRVFLSGFQKDMRAVNALCDVYLNPRRPGGGMSASSALADGLAMVTLPDCDVATIFGNERACSDWTSYSERCFTLATDPAYLRHCREESRTIFASVPTISTAADRFLAILSETAERFHASRT